MVALFCVFALVAQICFASSAVAQSLANPSDTSWYNSTDTTFTLTTRAQIYGLAQIANGGSSVHDDFKGKTIKLGADITLNDNPENYASWNMDSGDVLAWSPIGSNGLTFAGTFDGQDHTLTGLFINSDKTPDKASALFGTIAATGDVKNFTLENVRQYSETKWQIKRLSSVFIQNYGMVSSVAVDKVAMLATSSADGFGAINHGTVKQCSVSNFLAVGDSTIDGFIGQNEAAGIIDLCRVESFEITGAAGIFVDNFCSGFLNSNAGVVRNSFASDVLFSWDQKRVNLFSRGLVSYNTGTIANCYAQVDTHFSRPAEFATVGGRGSNENIIRNVFGSRPREEWGIKGLTLSSAGVFMSADGQTKLIDELEKGVDKSQGDCDWIERDGKQPVPGCRLVIDCLDGTAQRQTIVAFGSSLKEPNPTRNGYQFKGWYTDEELTERWDISQDVIAGDTTLYAKWEKSPEPDFAITIGSSKGGKVEATPIRAKKGVTVTLVAASSKGYKFVSFEVDGVRIEGSTFTMPAKSVSVKGIFALKTFKISAPVSSSKAGRVTGKRTVTYGGKTTLTARSRYGYHFVCWTKNGKTISRRSTLTVKNIKADATYRAIFARTSVMFKLKRISGRRITVRWQPVKGARSYQIVSKRAVGSAYRVRYTGINSTHLYTSIDKRCGVTYLYKMRYSKIVHGRRVWSAWTPMVAIK